MGRAQKQKGYRIEKKIIDMHNEYGISAKRMPLSGAAGGEFSGDVIIDLHNQRLIAEVKSRKGGAGFATIERWKGDNDALFLHRNNAEPLVVISTSLWLSLLGEQDASNTK